ncbi:hypothetical protein [Sorangium sp. So ce1335]|uniref:hypothetical protein n=1 Tax=Sorangium sp. So ce1335 TaxID=3133335 RepID=UPI003F60A1EE
MRITRAILVNFVFIAFGAAASCDGSTATPEPVAWAGQPWCGAGLTLTEAQSLVQAECKGTYTNRGRCVACVANAASALLREGLITSGQVGAIVSSFAHDECRSGCIPTSCAIEGESCGSIEDGCGSEIACGGCAEGETCVNGVCQSAGLKLLRCFCNDESLLQFCLDDIDCSSGPAQDVICGPACASHGGELGTGCLDENPICGCDGFCPAGELCVGGVCQAPQPGTAQQTCFCADGVEINMCLDIDCSGIAQDIVCIPLCAAHGGLSATGCSLDACAAAP